MTTIYSECVFVALSIQRKMRLGHIVICVFFGSAIFFHIISQTARLNTKCVLILSTIFVRKISHSKKNLVNYDQKCISVFM